jgi:hypothetical protein
LSEPVEFCFCFLAFAPAAPPVQQEVGLQQASLSFVYAIKQVGKVSNTKYPTLGNFWCTFRCVPIKELPLKIKGQAV